jgi:hypothetical protein
VEEAVTEDIFGGVLVVMLFLKELCFVLGGA